MTIIPVRLSFRTTNPFPGEEVQETLPSPCLCLNKWANIFYSLYFILFLLLTLLLAVRISLLFINLYKWVTMNLTLAKRWDGLQPSPGRVEIVLVALRYRNRDKLRPDWPLCSYADLTFYLFVSPTGEIRHREEQTSLCPGKKQGEKVNPRIDLIPYCKLFLDIVSRLPFPMCS